MPTIRLDQKANLVGRFIGPDGEVRESNGPITWSMHALVGGPNGTLTPNEDGSRAVYEPERVGIVSILIKGKSPTGKALEDVFLLEVTPARAVMVVITQPHEGRDTIDSTKIGTTVNAGYTINAEFLDAKNNPVAISQEINWTREDPNGLATPASIETEHTKQLFVSLLKDGVGTASFTITASNKLPGETNDGDVLSATCDIVLMAGDDVQLDVELDSIEGDRLDPDYIPPPPPPDEQ